MDFFAAQAAAHTRTRMLLVGYLLAVGAVVAAITWIVLWAYALFSTNIYSSVPYSDRVIARPGLALVTALGVLGVIGVAALHRMAQLSAGGGAVATSLGASRVTRETADPKRRRLLNVVEELAIASGIPVPEVYVLDQEPGINAFAAGYTPADAAVTVTRGTLERLDRAELAGVIGHEFSHILNGDMRLNTRLTGPLFGLLVIAIVARYTLRGFRGSSSRVMPWLIAALVIMGLGYVGVLFGRLLQAAICRQREFLADASSVQFTRDPGGLRDALVRIARTPEGSEVHCADAEDLAHLFIAPARQRLFSTHPPLAARILRLDPHYDLSSLATPDTSVPEPDEGPPAAGAPVAALAGGAPLSSHVGNPGIPAVGYAAALRMALPATLEAALARGSTAACLWLAVSLSAEPSVRTQQLARIAATLGEPVAKAVGLLTREVAAVPVAQYLPLLQRALPVLKALPRERRAALASLTKELAHADARISPLEYLLGALATRYLSDQVDPPRAPGALGLQECAAALGALFSVIASAGRDDEVEARRAYERGLATLLPRERPPFAAPDPAAWPAALDAALGELQKLRPAAKELLVDGLGHTLTHDGTVRIEEAELVRAVCALLRCPLPPLLSLPEVA